MVQYLPSGSGSPVWAGSLPTARDLFVDHAVGRHMDEAEPAQLARCGKPVELGLTRVGPERSAWADLGLEESGRAPRPRIACRARARNPLRPSRCRQHHLLIARSAAIASGACPRVDHHTELASGQIDADDPALSPETSTPIVRSPSVTTLRSPFLCRAIPLYVRSHPPLQAVNRSAASGTPGRPRATQQRPNVSRAAAWAPPRPARPESGSPRGEQTGLPVRPGVCLAGI